MELCLLVHVLSVVGFLVLVDARNPGSHQLVIREYFRGEGLNRH